MYKLIIFIYSSVIFLKLLKELQEHKQKKKMLTSLKSQYNEDKNWHGHWIWIVNSGQYV